MNPPFTLEQIYLLDNDYIEKLLTKNNTAISPDALHNRLAATILLHNGDFVTATDRHYIIHPQFNNLYMRLDQELSNLAQLQNYVFTEETNRFDLIRFLSAPPATVPTFTAPPLLAPKIQNIPQLSQNKGITPLISNVNILPAADRRGPEYVPEGLAIYQWLEKLFVCGPKTFQNKENIKNIVGAFWDNQQRCWSVPLNQSRAALLFIQRFTGEPPLPTDDIIQNATIALSEKIPAEIKDGYKVFRLISNPRMIYICGSKVKGTWRNDLLQKIPDIKASVNSNCLRAPVSSTDEALQYYTNKMETERHHKLEMQHHRAEEKRRKAAEKERKAQEARSLAQELARPESQDPDPNKTLEHLKQKWQNKLRKIEFHPEYRGTAVTVTYDGNLKPPDQALIYFVNGWFPLPPIAGGVQRVGFKKYLVTIILD